MVSYAIIETDEGMGVAELKSGLSAEQTAEAQGGQVVDPGPYTDYEEAYDALMALGEDEEESDE
jgi:hypothetical protein